MQLASAGVRRLTGPLQLQSSKGPANAIYPAAWSSRHQGRIFAPLVGPLTLHENIVWITVRPGEKVGQRVRVIETAPDGIGSMVTVTATTRSGRRSRLALRPRADGGWVVSGTLGVRAAPRRLTAVARDPRAVLSAVWGAALRRAGIVWNANGLAIGAPPSGGPQILAEVASPPLDSLASEINRRSLNLGAELLLQWAGGRERGPALLTDHVRQVVRVQRRASTWSTAAGSPTTTGSRRQPSSPTSPSSPPRRPGGTSRSCCPPTGPVPCID